MTKFGTFHFPWPFSESRFATVGIFWRRPDIWWIVATMGDQLMHAATSHQNISNYFDNIRMMNGSSNQDFLRIFPITLTLFYE